MFSLLCYLDMVQSYGLMILLSLETAEWSWLYMDFQYLLFILSDDIKRKGIRLLPHTFSMS